MRKVLTLGVVLLSGLLLACPESFAGEETIQADLFVAPNGDDSNPGTKEKPLATLRGARDAVRRLKKGGLSKDITVLVRGGVYTLEEPLVFQLEDSGTQDHSITYAAYPGERPVFSGGRPIKSFKQGHGGRWTAEMAEVKAGNWFFDQLFVGGQRRPRARHPNEGYFRVVAAGPDNRTSFQFREQDIQPYNNLADARVVFLHDWSVSRVGIKSVDGATKTATFTDPIGAAGHGFFRITGFEPHPRYYVEHAQELLDAPGEWYLDRIRGVLSYLPKPEEEMDRTEVVAPVLEQLLVLRGDGDRPIQNVRFAGLTFAHGAAPSFASGYAGIQAGFHEPRTPESKGHWRGRMPAAVVFESAAGCRLEDCRIAHVGGTAFSLQGRSVGNQVIGNEIVDAGGNGVMVGEPSTAVEMVAKNNVVANNHVHHCGAIYHGCVGIWAGITEGTVIAHNEIHDMPYSGVSVGWMWNTTPTPCQGNLVEYNHIHHVMQILSDGGGIYTLGRQPGTALRGNLIHDVPVNAGRAESNGMFIDEGSSEILIAGNTIYNTARSPIRFHKAVNNTLHKNVLVISDGIPAFRYNATDPNSMTYQENATPDAKSWEPPKLSDTTAGLQPPYRERLLED